MTKMKDEHLRSTDPPYRLEEGRAVLDSERDRIFGGWMAGVLVTALPPVICTTAFFLASWRINDKVFGDNWPLLAGLVFVCAYSAAAGVWKARRSPGARANVAANRLRARGPHRSRAVTAETFPQTFRRRGGTSRGQDFREDVRLLADGMV